MPITKSAKKSLKVSRVKQAQNFKAKVALNKALKNVDEKSVNQTVSTIDKSAKVGIIHKNKAARLKSALSRKFATAKVEAVKPIKKTVAKKAVTKKTTAKKTK
jgi:small subunit ribosomal protein S20